MELFKASIFESFRSLTSKRCHGLPMPCQVGAV